MKKKAKKIYICILVAILLGAILIFLSLQPQEGEIREDGCGENTVIYENPEICWQKAVKPELAQSWQDASTYCEALVLGDKDDWRLPTNEELSRLIIINPGKVAINESVFTGTEKIYYWTSTKDVTKENFYGYVHFVEGFQGFSPDHTKNYGVRCVRENTLL